LSVEAAIDGGLERLCNEFPTTLGASLTILSEVRCNDGLKCHLPMLDFHAFTSAASQRIVEAVAALTTAGYAGMLTGPHHWFLV
jgi:hypothetical protein